MRKDLPTKTDTFRKNLNRASINRYDKAGKRRTSRSVHDCDEI
jgi:hypothetical protein